MLSLGLTKAGKRQGAAESITIHMEDLCRRLFQWEKIAHCREASLTGPSHQWRKTFTEVIKAVGLESYDYRPYSLRRGGATHYFQLHGRFGSFLVQGRWQSASTARVYINQGIAVLAEISFSWNPVTKNLTSQNLTSLTKPLPKLELTKQPSQKRGRWKRAKKETCNCLTSGFRRALE